MEFKHDANMKASLGHTRTRDVTVVALLLNFILPKNMDIQKLSVE